MEKAVIGQDSGTNDNVAFRNPFPIINKVIINKGGARKLITVLVFQCLISQEIVLTEI